MMNRKALFKRRALEGLAMLLVGDGALALVDPRGHAELWRDGPRYWRALIEPFVRSPGLTFTVGAAMVTAGVLLASRVYRRPLPRASRPAAPHRPTQ